jgi:hypothetical protein
MPSPKVVSGVLRHRRETFGALTKGDSAAANEALDATLSVLVFPELERPYPGPAR